MKWTRISDYCVQSEDKDWTICKVFVTGWVYELWKGREQVSVGMFTAQDAIRLHASITVTTQEAGAKSTQSQDGDRPEASESRLPSMSATG